MSVKQQRAANAEVIVNLKTVPILLLLGCAGTDCSYPNVRFSNRPFEVKRFQTIHQCNVDVAHGLVLLFGIGTGALVWGFLCQGIRQGGASFSFVGFLI
jgi:hypothetical protein